MFNPQFGIWFVSVFWLMIAMTYTLQHSPHLNHTPRSSQRMKGDVCHSTTIPRIVQRLNDKLGPNCALYDKSMNLGTIKLDTIRVIWKTGDILDLDRSGRGSHFPRLPSVSKIGKYANHKSHVKSLIVDIVLVKSNLIHMNSKHYEKNFKRSMAYCLFIPWRPFSKMVAVRQ